jgi:hypothetical protein
MIFLVVLKYQKLQTIPKTPVDANAISVRVEEDD